jgi:hypothetical protein
MQLDIPGRFFLQNSSTTLMLLSTGNDPFLHISFIFPLYFLHISFIFICSHISISAPYAQRNYKEASLCSFYYYCYYYIHHHRKHNCNHFYARFNEILSTHKNNLLFLFFSSSSFFHNLLINFNEILFPLYFMRKLVTEIIIFINY